MLSGRGERFISTPQRVGNGSSLRAEKKKKGFERKWGDISVLIRQGGGVVRCHITKGEDLKKKKGVHSLLFASDVWEGEDPEVGILLHRGGDPLRSISLCEMGKG